MKFISDPLIIIIIAAFFVESGVHAIVDFPFVNYSGVYFLSYVVSFVGQFYVQ